MFGWLRRKREPVDPTLHDWMVMPGQKPRIPRRRRRHLAVAVRPECHGCPIANLTNCGQCVDEETDWLEGRAGKMWFCRMLKWLAWKWRRLTRRRNPFEGVGVLIKWKLTPDGRRGDPRPWWRKLKR